MLGRNPSDGETAFPRSINIGSGIDHGKTRQRSTMLTASELERRAHFGTLKME